MLLGVIREAGGLDSDASSVTERRSSASIEKFHL